MVFSTGYAGAFRLHHRSGLRIAVRVWDIVTLYEPPHKHHLRRGIFPLVSSLAPRSTRRRSLQSGPFSGFRGKQFFRSPSLTVFAFGLSLDSRGKPQTHTFGHRSSAKSLTPHDSKKTGFPIRYLVTRRLVRHIAAKSPSPVRVRRISFFNRPARSEVNDSPHHVDGFHEILFTLVNQMVVFP